MRRIASNLTVVLLVLLLSNCVFAGGDPHAQAEWADFQRHAKLCSEDGLKLGVENVRWHRDADGSVSTFKTVFIDCSKVKDVYFWAESFTPTWIAAHGMLAFVFEDTSAVVSEDDKNDIGFVVSIEARLKKGQSYDIIRGLGKTYKLVYVVSSLSDRIIRTVGDQQHTVSQYRLELTTEQKVALVKNTILKSCEDRQHVFYNTINESCVTHCIECINTVLPSTQKVKVHLAGRIVPNPLVAYPKATGPTLVRRKLAIRFPDIDPRQYEQRYLLIDGSTFVVPLSGPYNQVQVDNFADLYSRTQKVSEL